MKSVTRSRISPPIVKGDTTREFVLLCCILFIFSQSILPVLTRNTPSATRFRLFQSSPDSLMLVTSPLQTEEQSSTHPPQFTPFFFKPVPLNSCGKKLLLSIPGIGPSIADAILKTRVDIGTFHDMQDLLLVPGIGKSRMHKFSKHFSFEKRPTVN